MRLRTRTGLIDLPWRVLLDLRPEMSTRIRASPRMQAPRRPWICKPPHGLLKISVPLGSPGAGPELDAPELPARIAPDRDSVPEGPERRGTGWSHRLSSFSDPPEKRGLPCFSRKSASIAAVLSMLSCRAAAAFLSSAGSLLCDESGDQGPQTECLEVAAGTVSVCAG